MPINLGFVHPCSKGIGYDKLPLGVTVHGSVSHPRCIPALHQQSQDRLQIHRDQDKAVTEDEWCKEYYLLVKLNLWNCVLLSSSNSWDVFYIVYGIYRILSNKYFQIAGHFYML